MYQLTVPSFRTVALALALALGFAGNAFADEDHENMKVLDHTGAKLKKAMKNLSKGLGVKCTTCHVKKDFDSEKKPMKDKSRAFFRATVGESDKAVRAAALKDLLKLLELDAAKNETKVWAGIDGMKKKAD